MMMWNCRGLGKPLTVHNIKEINRSRSPEVLFLCETKNSSSFVTGQCHKLGFTNVSCVEPQGLAGGLVLAWREGVDIAVVKSVEFFIYFRWTNRRLQRECGVIAVHLHSEEGLRNQQYGTILNQLEGMEDPYMVIGDFNDIMAHDEKDGGRMKLVASIENFNNFINAAGLIDLGYEGSKFTWCNKQFGGNLIRERLDRCLVSMNLLELYSGAAIFHLNDQGSDHRPLLFESEVEQRRFKRRFRFQERWCDNEVVGQIVKDTWKESIEGSPMFRLYTKLKIVRHRLVEWQQQPGSNSLRQIQQLKQKIEEEKSKAQQADNFCIKVLEEELTEAYLSEERYWKEKAREQWLKYGDQNTKYFHSRAQMRNKHNRI
ncbi:uncharacterized protein [Arachis hypogaea]|uniref:uncharacterized protein n=1 Tax=Arachis hypogaea TaxID=3818 RepID=UPI003B21CEAE